MTETAPSSAPPPAARDDAERLFPLQFTSNDQRKMYGKQVHKTIPWSVAEKAYPAYCDAGGRGQTLDRLAERGGFSHGDMDLFYPEWRNEVDTLAKLNSELDAARAEIATLKTDRDSWRRVCERLETELFRSAAPSDDLRAENERLRKWISAALEQFEKYPGRAVGMLRYALNPTEPSRCDWDIGALASPQPNAGTRGEADLITGRMANERETRDAVHSGNIDRDSAVRNSTSINAPSSPQPNAGTRGDPYWTEGNLNPPRGPVIDLGDAEAAPPIGETFGPAHDEIWAEYYSSEAAPPSADDMAQARELITRWNKVWQSGEDIDFSLQQEIATAIRTARQAGVRAGREQNNAVVIAAKHLLEIAGTARPSVNAAVVTHTEN